MAKKQPPSQRDPSPTHTLEELRTASLGLVALALLALAIPALERRRPGLARRLRDATRDPVARLKDALTALAIRDVGPSLARAIKDLWGQAEETFDWLTGQAPQELPYLALATQDALRLTRHEIGALRRQVAAGEFGRGKAPKAVGDPRLDYQAYRILVKAFRANRIQTRDDLVLVFRRLPGAPDPIPPLVARLDVDELKAGEAEDAAIKVLVEWRRYKASYLRRVLEAADPVRAFLGLGKGLPLPVRGLRLTIPKAQRDPSQPR